jgi:hypothetical protein
MIKIGALVPLQAIIACVLVNPKKEEDIKAKVLYQRKNFRSGFKLHAKKLLTMSVPNEHIQKWV